MNLLKIFLKISFKEIWSYKLVIKELSQPIHCKYQIPIKELFKIIRFNYETDQSMVLYRKRNWIVNILLFNLLLNILRYLVYTFLDPNDQMFRLYCGDLIEFADGETAFISIAAMAYTAYSTVVFLMFQYLPVNQFKWFNIFNAIEGKQSFVTNKIFMKKSAKK